MIAALFGYSYALNVPHFTIETWEGCKREGCVPFRLASQGLLLTAGYAFCFLTLGPLGFFTLQENMLAQKISFVLLVALTLQFLAYFVTSPDPHRVAVVGPRPWDVVGVVIFNFAFCVTVPAWLNEKVPQVNAKKTIWAACLSSAVAYCLVGWLGGVAIARASDNVLDELTSSLAPTSVRFGGGVFAFAIIGLGVPVYCVLMRYNLRAGGLSEFWSHILAGAGPWAVSWLVSVWKSTSVSGAPDNSSRSHFSAMTWPRWLRRTVRNRHRHAIEQASRRWRGGRRGDSDESTVKF